MQGSAEVAGWGWDGLRSKRSTVSGDDHLHMKCQCSHSKSHDPFTNPQIRFIPTPIPILSHLLPLCKSLHFSNPNFIPKNVGIQKRLDDYFNRVVERSTFGKGTTSLRGCALSKYLF